MDRQTDRRTDRFAISISRVSILTRDKKNNPAWCIRIATVCVCVCVRARSDDVSFTWHTVDERECRWRNHEVVIILSSLSPISSSKGTDKNHGTKGHRTKGHKIEGHWDKRPRDKRHWTQHQYATELSRCARTTTSGFINSEFLRGVGFV